ncbi:MAG TPA: glycine cleavage system protein GcvH [Kaistiaceae bacterium]|nr:glycine cleavage system protein GcvH [Kaistiaceae bacterium]
MSGADEVRDDRRYTKDHEWAREDGPEVLVGVTAFAVDQLGDVTLVALDVKVGDVVEAGKPFGAIESVKTVSDLFAPVSGKVTRLNDRLDTAPELVNEDPWEAAWMLAISPSALAEERERLLDASSYRRLIAEAH